MKQAISRLVTEFRKSIIQSEAEVRSKFIIPLLVILGYPSELRAEEFNVYGYAGSKKLNAKPADFILFKQKDFALHRSNNEKNKLWVEENSLLVIEAKKTNCMPVDLGQAKFYTLWTRAIAYIVTDGIRFQAYYYNPINRDYEIVNTKVDDLTEEENIKMLAQVSYEKLLRIKSNGDSIDGIYNMPKGVDSEYEIGAEVLNIHADLGLPSKYMMGIKKALGKNANNLTDVQVMGKFLRMTEAYLNNDMRYGIPEYMISIPRGEAPASLYLDNDIIPLTSGTVRFFYRDEDENYLFYNSFLELFICCNSNTLFQFYIDYHVLDSSVSKRIEYLKEVKRCFNAKTISVVIEDKSDMKRHILIQNEKYDTVNDIKDDLEILDFWLTGMEKLKEIEIYYVIKFNLVPLDSIEDLKNTYIAIETVYNGIFHKENYYVIISNETGLLDGYIIVNEITLYNDKGDTQIDNYNIYGVIFKPRRSYLLPGKTKINGSSEIKLSASCEFEIISK